MDTKEKIAGDLKEAMKNKEELRLSVLRMIFSALHNKEIEKRGRGLPAKLSVEEVVAVLRTEVKKRKDSVESFEKGGRQELAEKEKKEIKIIEPYLPSELSDSDLEKIVSEVVAAAGEVTQKDFGRVMGEVMKKIKGQASGDRVSALVKKHLYK
ncbi:MAG: GatB/YqeY domain-containing protein [bacterium]|nr:GatB/YqeY domain-containing protein [bacterium]